ncbi:group I truncated hemoglobin [Ramlibacter sp. MAHUQ-53]|uniref:group I truncated hemoglobin n=1 Tax=unclassified Ramlibacter TaxID=2617605 RepID=UPI00362A2CB6
MSSAEALRMLGQYPETLFDKYGGAPTVGALTRDFYRRIMSNPMLKGYFAGVDTERMIRHQIVFIAWVMGKPDKPYSHDQLRNAHITRKITSAAYEEVIRILQQALVAANVELDDQREIIERIDGHRHLIVTG